MTGLAALLALGMVQLDATLPPGALDGAWFIYESDVEGARGVLLAIAGTVVALIGTIFALTVVPLTVAAAQLGPRLLRNFLRDIGTQVTLGTFCATFVYAVLVLLELPAVGGRPPQLAVTLSPLLLLVTVGVLIYFIHHLSISVQATNVIREVSEELERVIREAFPQPSGGAGAPPDAAAGMVAVVEREGAAVAAGASGYVRTVDFESLERLACERDGVLRLRAVAGDFVVAGEPLALVWPAACLDDALAAGVNASYFLGEQRTLTQDVEFGINALAEVAMRAMSPAINDPFTAMACVDRLCAALALVLERERAPLHRYDGMGRARVLADQITFGRLTDAAFHQIRQYGRGNAEVLIRMLHALALLAGRAVADEERHALLRHAQLIEQDARAALPSSADQERVRRAYEAAAQILAAVPTPAERRG